MITDRPGSSHPLAPSSPLRAPRPASVRPVPRRPVAPYLADLGAAPDAPAPDPLDHRLTVASYNVHRWAGVRGGRAFYPDRALDVLGELGTDVIALQEALRPTSGRDPIREAAQRLGFHFAFVVTRPHRAGALGNVVLSRWPIAAAHAIDLSFGRLERRAAVAVRLQTGSGWLTVAATHLALVDRTRARQVRALLDHPELAGPTILAGDMNAWRPTVASRELDDAFTDRHHNDSWPASYPSVRPVLALDRLYARGARLVDLRAHDSPAARTASDHLPVVASVEIDEALSASASTDQTDRTRAVREAG